MSLFHESVTSDSDCVNAAHHDAAVKSKIIHRDISSGNILILPTFEERDDGNGGTKFVVSWRGILADWELSKPISDNPEDELARQPERTVCLLPSYLLLAVDH